MLHVYNYKQQLLLTLKCLPGCVITSDWFTQVAAAAAAAGMHLLAPSACWYRHAGCQAPCSAKLCFQSPRSANCSTALQHSMCRHVLHVLDKQQHVCVCHCCVCASYCCHSLVQATMLTLLLITSACYWHTSCWKKAAFTSLT
jgi:hypothetical protein